MYAISLLVFFFFFNDTATTEIYTLSLHDALPILDEQLEKEALKLANEKIQEVKSDKERLLEEKQKKFDEVLIEIAKDLLKKNEIRIGKNTAKKAIEKLDEQKKSQPKKKEAK